MTTDNRRQQVRRAVATADKKRREAGDTRLTVWITPETRSKLDAVRRLHGSNEKAVAEGIAALHGQQGEA
jgi:hypothetical protein